MVDDGKVTPVGGNDSGLKYLWFAALAALLLRLLFLLEYTQQNPFYVHPILDSAFYLNWADAIQENKTFFMEEFHHPPGYAYFLSIVLWISGGNTFAVLVLQTIFLTATGVLVFVAARQLLNSVVAAWTAYLLFTLCGPLTFYSFKVLSETLYGFLLFASFFSILRYTKSQWMPALFAGGVLLGMAAEVRGNAALCIFPAALAVARATPSGVRKMKSLMVLIAGTAVFIAPVLIRNIAVAGAWTPVASNWGENFYFANNSTATGSFSSGPGFGASLEAQIESVRKEASRLSGTTLTSQQAQRFWFSKGIDYIRTNTIDWFRLEARKAVRIFWGGEASSIYYFGLETAIFQQSFRFLFVNYGLILFLFFAGIVCIPDLRQFELLFGLLLTQGFLFFVFWPELRFEMPLFPFLIIVGSGITCIQSGALKNGKRLIFAGAGIAFWLFSNTVAAPEIRGHESWYTNAASALMTDQRYPESENMAQTAVRINPLYTDAWVNLGTARYAQHQADHAEAAWKKALELSPEHPVALRNMALLSEERQRIQDAILWWTRARDAARKADAQSEVAAIQKEIERLQRQ